MRKFKFTKKNTTILVAVLAVFWVIGTVTDSTDKDEVVDSKPKTEDTIEKPKEKAEEKKVEVDPSLSTKENIENILKANLKSNEILEISYEEAEDVAPLFIKTKGSSMFFDTTWYTIVESTIRHMPDELKLKISEYNFEIHSDFIDKFGNNVDAKAMTFKVDKETASKTNWVMMHPEKFKALLTDVWENPAVQK